MNLDDQQLKGDKSDYDVTDAKKGPTPQLGHPTRVTEAVPNGAV